MWEPFLHPKGSKTGQIVTQRSCSDQLTIEKVTKEILDEGILGAHRPVHVDHLIENTAVIALQLIDMRLHVLLRGYELVDMTLHLVDRGRVLCRLRRVAVLRFMMMVHDGSGLRLSSSASAASALADRRRLALDVLHPFQVMDAELGMAERPAMFAIGIFVGVLNLRRLALDQGPAVRNCIPTSYDNMEEVNLRHACLELNRRRGGVCQRDWGRCHCGAVYLYGHVCAGIEKPPRVLSGWKEKTGALGLAPDRRRQGAKDCGWGKRLSPCGNHTC